MLSRFSVKKPFTIIVCVIIAIILGGVSLSKMKVDLLPRMDLPYMAVIVTDPGSTAEKVETEVTNVLEDKLSTINGVSGTMSQSSDNYSMVFIEFEDGTNMDSAMVKVSSAVNEVTPDLPDTAGTPNYLEMSMDMMASLYVGITDSDRNIYDLSDLVNDKIIPQLKRTDGVADVSPTGAVEQTVEVRLNDSKIEDVNNELLKSVNSELADSKKDLDDGFKKLDEAKDKIGDQKKSLANQQKDTTSQLGKGDSALTAGIAGLTSQIAALSLQKATLQAQISAAKAQIESAKKQQKAGADAASKQGQDTSQSAAAQQAQQAAAAQQQAATDPSAAAADPSAAAAAAMAGNAAAAGAGQSGAAGNDASAYMGAMTQDPAAAAAAAGNDPTAAGNAAGANGNGSIPAGASGATDPSAGSAAGMGSAAGASPAEDPNAQIAKMEKQVKALDKQISKAQGNLKKMQGQLAKAQAGGLDAASGFGSADAQLASAEKSLDQNKTELEKAQDQYEEARDKAIEQASIDALVDKETLSKLITAQNFSMPAGYMESNDKNDDQWLLRVGTEIKNEKELKNLLLANIKGIGNVRLKDVADVTVIDNSGDAYMRMDGKDGVMLSIFKSSTANASEVSTSCKAALAKISEEYPSLSVTTLSDEGQFIQLVIDYVLQSLLIGALLAVVVLALFLRDWKPTLVVAFSIPFSVLCSLILMYFSGLTLNIMTLAGISLAIGMLVDNSIIVLENIYRLRAQGMSAPRAAYQGAKQIAGAAIASTLTTVCVFMPVAFTEGIVNQLMLPFALVIAYVLASSLIIALTLVPTLSSFIFKSYKPRNNSWFEKLQDSYANVLSNVLKHKVLPLIVAFALLGGATAAVVNMGIIMIPSMYTRAAQVQVEFPEGTTQKHAYKEADKLLDIATTIPGVKSVAGMDGTSTVSMISSAASGASDDLHRMFSLYLVVDDSVTTEQQVKDVLDEFAGKTKKVKADISTDATSSAMMGSMLGSGLSLTITGPDSDKLVDLSKQFMDTVGEVKGYSEIENGMEDANHEVTLVVDRDKLTKKGYTVAQLYGDLSGMLTTDTTSTTLSVDKRDLDVKIVDETKKIDKDKLLDTKVDITDEEGNTKTVRLRSIATVKEGLSSNTVSHTDGDKTMTITATVDEGYNNALLSRELSEKLEKIDLPDGYSYSLGGELENINTMMEQMMLLLVLGFVLIYLIMVAQFQSLLSPFIILFTVPLAFTGGLFALLLAGEKLSLLALMGFAVLMGTVVNNGIVFVDFTNQLRIGGLGKREALIAAGRTRMRPILMTALTTIFAMMPLVFGTSIGSGMQRGMALVVAGGLLYATFMTLFIVPIMYDLLYRRTPKEVDLGEEDIDESYNDATAFLESYETENAAAGINGSSDSADNAPSAPGNAGKRP